ncbi:hypothetical protein ACFYOV_15610 [Streptomyces sp. NPDC005931]|uniref:hypothetical protein n=1 Tax=Streptomyces sp. NPDC005931 TaxID=3364737 RepID=UPI0036CAE67A
MQKLKRVATVAAMVGGLGLVGGGVASASANYDHDHDYPFDIVIGNAQFVECDQSFDAGTVTLVPPTTGDQEVNIGNECTVVGSVED